MRFLIGTLRVFSLCCWRRAGKPRQGAAVRGGGGVRQSRGRPRICRCHGAQALCWRLPICHNRDKAGPPNIGLPQRSRWTGRLRRRRWPVRSANLRSRDAYARLGRRRSGRGWRSLPRKSRFRGRRRYWGLCPHFRHTSRLRSNRCQSFLQRALGVIPLPFRHQRWSRWRAWVLIFV